MQVAALVLLVGIASFALCVALVPPTRALARRLGVLDAPGPRKVHTVPTPRLGGLAVWLSFTAVVLAGYFLAPVLPRAWAQAAFGHPLELLTEAPRVAGRLLALLAAGTLCFAVGLVDDALGAGFPLLAKLGGQTLAAAVLIAADVRVSFLPYEWMNVAVTFLWLVGITNAFNFLDNLDGLAVGVAAVACGVLLINAWSLGEYFICLILVAFMGSLLGFLVFNWSPASIFLGDCGALFIGFVMASLTLLERYVSPVSSTLFPVLMPVLVLAVPLIDTPTVIVTRLWEGRPVYVGDSRHLSHRLLSLGFSPRNAVRILCVLTLALGLGAVSLTEASVTQSLLILTQGLAFVLIALVLIFRERRKKPRP